MGRWAPHLEQPGAVKRWQLGSTKYLGLGQKSITASLTVALGPKGRPWWGRRCKGHSPLRGEAPGLDGQHRRAPTTTPRPASAEMNMKLVCCCFETRTRDSLGSAGLAEYNLCPHKECCPSAKEVGARPVPPSQRALGHSGTLLPQGPAPCLPEANIVGSGSRIPLFHFPGGYQLPEHPVHLLSWNPSTHHLALFEIPSHQAFQFGGQVWGLGKEGLGVLARAQQPQPLELHEGQPAAPSPRAVQVRA